MPMSHRPGNLADKRSWGLLPSLVLVLSLIVVIWACQPKQATPDLSTADEAVPLRRIGFACEGQTDRLNPDKACRPVEVPQTPRTGPFDAGAIDLTGDGVPEQVQLAEEQVAVSRNGTEVWRGLPEWRVVDLALGDPNDDGRGELLLALWKLPEVEGVPGGLLEPSSGSVETKAQAKGLVEASHPFIIGYREGAYRILWGGSAVVDPICEVELGDVDGDGIQELIVLEERGEGLDRAVTVWHWHGWGFSLIWRSPPGRYRDLALMADNADHPLVISVAIEP
jgi:hypothetical protein